MPPLAPFAQTLEITGEFADAADAARTLPPAFRR